MKSKLSIASFCWSWIGLCGFVALIAAAHEDEDGVKKPVVVTHQQRYAATVMPDRILLSWQHNPATSFSVTWRTDMTVDVGLGEIAVATDGPKFTSKKTVVEATRVTYKPEFGEVHHYTVAFTQLKPETQYVYRVGDGVNWSEWIQVTTAADQAKPFRFAYFGDSQNSVWSMWSRVVRQSYKNAPKSAFFLHAGDLVNKTNSDGEWGEWFQAGGFIHSSTPVVACPGNHEYSSKLSTHWRPTFAFPENGPKDLMETVFYIDYQGMRLVVLNSNEGLEEQAQWLESVLQDNPQKWTVVCQHHPIYSSKAGRDNPLLRNTLQPIFDKYKVDLVLQGHDHTYARSGMMTWQNVPKGVTTRTDTGTVYVVSVSGPKLYGLGMRPFFKRVAADAQLVRVIDVDGDEILFDARPARVLFHDAFTL
ncbi:MAG: metallophosphoesterase family protein, partial [Planctomycetes bacterium]|nr:metallophosphoesterase family protein [Planctomycetota bacterium]